MARKKAVPDFEHSLAELQTLVERLESGELSLEDSLTAFEQGDVYKRQQHIAEALGRERQAQGAIAANAYRTTGFTHLQLQFGQLATLHVQANRVLRGYPECVAGKHVASAERR